MNQLLAEMAGWLGYLERPVVVVQLLVAALLAGVHRLTARRRRLGPPMLKGGAPLLAGLAAATALLALAGLPWGLLALLLALVAGWYGLGLLRLLLGHLIPPRELALVDTRLIRPSYLTLAALALLRQVDNPRDLALIPLGSWFGTPISLGQVVLSLAVVYLLAMGTGPPAHGLAWLVQRVLGLSDGSRRALALTIRYLLTGAGIVWALDYIGINRTALLAVAGGLSVGLGFGVKEVFSNFVSGLWLLFEGSVRPGEVLYVEGDPCEVRSLGLRAALLWRDRDNAELVIPNQTFFTTTTTTYTGSDRMRRSEVRVGAAYRHDPEVVIAVLEATARAHPRVLADPPPRGLLVRFGDSAIEYALRFWIADPLQSGSISSEVQAAVWHAFRDQRIEMPFPQQVSYQMEGPP